MTGLLFFVMMNIKKIVFISPVVVLSTKISCHESTATKTRIMNIYRFGQSLKDFIDLFLGIFRADFSLFPFFRMVLQHMFSIVRKQFKIFNPIVRLITIYVVDTFALPKFSTKILLHNISMLKNALIVYKNTDITQFCKRWFSLLEIGPIGRYIITSVSKPSASMYLTDAAIILFENVRTIWDFAYSRCIHMSNHNVKGSTCQW